MSKALVFGPCALALSAGTAWAQGYGYGYGYGHDNGYGYGATAPLYDYAASGYGYAVPGYVAPAQRATTIIIVTPAPAYTAPPVASGYYAAPSTVVSRPLYGYAPGYWGGYGRAGYGWGGYGWR
jgi:hypothetical protein